MNANSYIVLRASKLSRLVCGSVFISSRYYFLYLLFIITILLFEWALHCCELYAQYAHYE